MGLIKPVGEPFYTLWKGVDQIDSEKVNGQVLPVLYLTEKAANDGLKFRNRPGFIVMGLRREILLSFLEQFNFFVVVKDVEANGWVSAILSKEKVRHEYL
ncbi:hypothetical protein V7111_16355 [Neobacillus niacini]|uniref:hypothetical protein n=1 Tax=Neobacillus niacini TaxID=86668 RepID=UPI003002483B